MALCSADHNVVMTPLGVWLTITTTVTAGILLGVVLSWIDPPSWVTPLRLAAILVLAAAADSVVIYVQQTVPVVASASGQDATAASEAGLVPVSKLDPNQASRAVLSITGETSGNPRLVESSLDAIVHKALGPGPLGGPFAVFDGHVLIVAAGTDSKPHASGLGIATTSGSLTRTLTSPHADVTDTDPAVTSSGQVYFLRTVTQWSGPNGTPLRTTLMEIPLSGAGPAVPAPAADPPIYGALSVNAEGTLLAAQCQPPANDGTTEACVYGLPSGRIRYVTDFDGSAPVTDVSISPDGRYLAYGDAAANPYGGIQLYVRDLATGSTVRVSSQPGNNQQPSWVSGSAVPCLLFSNTETSGDVVYLSCLTAQPGTAKIATGDYPAWLGAPLPPAASPRRTIDWRAQWERYQSTVMLVLSVMVGLLIGLVSGWVDRPTWVSRPQLICLIVILGALQVAGPLIVPRVFGQASGGLTTVAQLDPAQAGGILLAEPTTTQDGQLVGVRLNGTDEEPLQFYPGGSTFIPVGDSASSFVLNYGDATDADIQLTGPTGNEIRELAVPPPGKTDESPALAATAREVFFEQDSIIPDGPGSSLIANPSVMEVSLAGGDMRHVTLNPPPANGPISVNATATELAAPCTLGNAIYACVYDLSQGRLRYKAQTPVTELALSPDGQYLAYGGGTTLHAYSLQTHTTYTVSSLPGFNEQPDWLQGGTDPCLLFTNMQTAANWIYLECLTPQPSWAQVTQGEYPEWLGP
jgi:WD40 repeat protein